VQSVLALSNGSVWVGDVDALDIIHSDRVSAIAAGRGLPGQIVNAMFEDSTGRVTNMPTTCALIMITESERGGNARDVQSPKTVANDSRESSPTTFPRSSTDF
jgi:hypothetical protein